MHDIEIPAPHGAQSLHAIGRVLGAAGISLEGGGMWSGQAHYLVDDAETAQQALEQAGLGPVTVRPVFIAALDADVPGALGRMMLQLAEAQVALRAQYSDHDNRKVLVVDHPEQAERARTALTP
ncbi:Uncharacterized conserved protein, contains tandem ACT domains [Quadrisphaera granulorum]|uniref:ACT domain-containing protein n=1 Tax=Quadrisphaera granulorum TaxID=317664 RepID=A0A315ZPV8_9ACTN|nr:amino acid-binding ACT domain-containing protein [Quadrisphaera granulorum]PWJ47611.1 hypothetical protein BXY45_13643 [Quadrisphaera granulorum]SZE98741.1 Uncharacterized conserved protein, contains tandem ACT domains [Quadrisphaera granulorum]